MYKIQAQKMGQNQSESKTLEYETDFDLSQVKPFGYKPILEVLIWHFHFFSARLVPINSKSSFLLLLKYQYPHLKVLQVLLKIFLVVHS